MNLHTIVIITTIILLDIIALSIIYKNTKTYLFCPLIFVCLIEIITTHPVFIDSYFREEISFIELFTVIPAPTMVALGSLVFKKKRIRTHPCQDEPDERSAFRLLILCTLMSTSLTIIYYKGLPPILKVSDWNGNLALYIIETRQYLHKSYVFGLTEYVGQGIIKRFCMASWTMTGIVALILALDRKIGCTAYGKVSRAVFAVCILGLFSSFEKRPPMILMISYFLLYLFYRQIRLKNIIVGTLVSIILLAIFTGIIGRGRLAGVYEERGTINAVFWQVKERLIRGNGQCTLDLIQLYPIYRYIGYGREHLEQLKAALPGVPDMPLEYKLYQWKFGDKQQRFTYNTPTYLGIVYADFRTPGVLIIYFLIGLAGMYCTRSAYVCFLGKTSILKKIAWIYLLTLISIIVIIGPVGVLVQFAVFAMLFISNIMILRILYFRNIRIRSLELRSLT